MTTFFAVRDPGRSGGSWFAYLCNVHPAGMRVLGEPHLETELDFGYPCPAQEYDERVIAWMESQELQAVASTGIIKCWRPWVERFVLGRGGRIIQLIRNPMEVVGSNMGKKPGVDRTFLGHVAKDINETFLAHCLYYKQAYEWHWSLRGKEPIVRIEDMNRSCGGDGKLLKAVMEHVTQVPWPDGYVQHIQQHYLPGYYYACIAIKDEKGVVVGIERPTYQYERWRLSWEDDPRAGELWETWGETCQQMFADTLGPISRQLGYNYWDRPGFTEVEWALRGQQPWGDADASLEPIPYTGTKEIRGAWVTPYALPEWRPE